MSGPLPLVSNFNPDTKQWTNAFKGLLQIIGYLWYNQVTHVPEILYLSLNVLSYQTIIVNSSI